MQTEHSMQYQYKSEANSFLDHIIIGDDTRCRQYRLQLKQQFMEWQREFSTEEKVQDAALSG